MPEATSVGLVRAATAPRPRDTVGAPARFALELHPGQDPVGVTAAVEHALADLGAQVSPLSVLEGEVLVVELPRRAIAEDAEPASVFAAGYAFAEEFGLVAAEPDLPTAFFPEEPRTRQVGPLAEVSVEGFPPGCWVSAESALDATPRWALEPGSTGRYAILYSLIKT